ncbi:enoyl-CoA hydratase/isomerase family protein [Bacillus sp. 165]|uniref:enoyl-CoA hydratase/isomerase family protein n=1 Tax=Bacillus sp. 165 TaxID=1529117 RepID=UPI001AD9E279|nr:enoyl-CoA hydratase/isomerase family protein [Bacillus sp. 165]MBO9130276.1 enoyl-CoA hydratase/isomerase family protein [Bacillus sp. 165]
MEKLIVERDEAGIVWVTLNRPERRNAVDYDVMDALDKVVREVSQSEKDKALVITGAGDKAFCSGGDLQQFHGLYTREEALEMLSKMGGILYKLMTLPKPTIALLNGTAVGGGCEIAAACDYRLAINTAQVGFVQGHLGITTGWGGGTMLYEKLRHDQAMQLLYSAKRYSAEEAHTIGFIHKIIDGDLKLSCRNWIEETLSPRAEVLAAYKKIAVRKWKVTGLQERMREEIEECAVLWEGDAHHQAVAAFLEG